VSALDSEIALSVYIDLDRAIDAADASSIRARWEFGRALLSERVGRKLPEGRLDEIVEAVGKSRAEIQYRMLFATRFPDANALLNAVEQWGSWHRVVNEALATPDELRADAARREAAPPTDGVPQPVFDLPEPVKTYTEVLPGSCPYCRHDLTIQAVYDPVGDTFRLLFIPEGKVGHDWFPDDDA
jgi:hypothetical protein